MLHCVLDVTTITALSASKEGFQSFLNSSRLAVLPTCVTVIVRVGAPGAVTVIVPVLGAVPIFSLVLILNEPLPVRLAGVIWLTVNHDWSLEGVFHVLSEYTVITPEAALIGDLALSVNNTRP